MLGGCEGPVEAAHLRYTALAYGRKNPGMSRKSDDCWVNPLCAKHHREQHAMNEERFWLDVVGIDPNPLYLDRYAAFKAGKDGLAIITAAIQARNAR